MAYMYTLGQQVDEELEKEILKEEEETIKDADGMDYVGFLGTNFGVSAGDIIGKITSAGSTLLRGGNTRVIFRSNVTPELQVDMSSLAGGEQQAVSSQRGSTLMKLIAPQVSLQAAGLRKSVAPYGRPIPNAWLIFLFVTVISGLIGAKIAWVACKKAPPKKD